MRTQRPSDNLFPTLTVREHLQLAATSHQPAIGVEELLDLLGIADRVDHRPSELSGGERQRAASPTFWRRAHGWFVADEPTAELDTQSAVGVLSNPEVAARFRCDLHPRHPRRDRHPGGGRACRAGVWAVAQQAPSTTRHAVEVSNGSRCGQERGGCCCARSEQHVKDLPGAVREHSCREGREPDRLQQRVGRTDREIGFGQDHVAELDRGLGTPGCRERQGGTKASGGGIPDLERDRCSAAATRPNG